MAAFYFIKFLNDQIPPQFLGVQVAATLAVVDDAVVHILISGTQALYSASEIFAPSLILTLQI